MVKLLRQFLLLIAPFLIWVVIVSMVDPFNAVHWSPHIAIPNRTKEQSLGHNVRSMARDWTLFKLEEYENDPRRCILFGDSRSFQMSVSNINQNLGEQVYNFGIPGGNTPTISDLFWFTASKTNLKQVYLQISFHTSGNIKSIATAPLAIVKKPTLYFVDNNVAARSLDCLWSIFVKNDRILKQVIDPQSQSNQFITNAKKIVSDMKYKVNDPEGMAALKRITSYCNSNHVQVFFINMPMHPFIHNALKNIGREDEYRIFKEQLSSMATLYDFDKPGEVDIPPEAFTDPVHLTKEYYDRIILQIWGSI